MRKRINSLRADLPVMHSIRDSGLNGISEPELVAKKMEELVDDCNGNSFIYGVRQKNCHEKMYALARLAVRRNWTFGVLYFYQNPPKGQRSVFDAEMVAKINEIAGDLFLGEFFGETGTNIAAKDKGYYYENAELEALIMPPQHFADMKEAKEHYVQFIKKMVDYNHSIGLHKTMTVEPTALHKYNLEAGVGIAGLEVMPGDPESLVAFTRGASIGYERSQWMAYVAQEWYGGYYHEDEMKFPRLDICYRWLYMNGVNYTNLESGSNVISSHGYVMPKGNPISRRYITSERAFAKFLESDKRPPCGPLAKVAFLHGNYDGYTGFLGGSSWCQFDRTEWGKDSAEHSWKILDEVYRTRHWHEVVTHGCDGDDLSNSPAYGIYDVLPVETSAEVMKGYDLLIFCGWHTMTEEIYENLKAYVKAGGHLLIGASHLSVSPRRGERKYLFDGQLSEFLGCNIIGEEYRNNGVKFTRNTMLENVFYPGNKNLAVDPIYPEGFATWVNVERTTAKVVAFFSNTFDVEDPNGNVKAALLENKYGNGIVSFMTNADYPGHKSVYPVYRAIVKELLTATHRNCPLKVICGDKIRYSFFFDDKTGTEKLYILNTDFNLKQNVIVKYKGKEQEVSLHPTEMISLDF